MLAIIRGLEEYRHYLEGHPLSFKIWSNYLNLTYFKSAQKFTRRQARWVLYLTCFNFQLHHKPGKTMQAKDSLSRKPDHENRIEHNNAESVLLKLEFFAIAAVNTAYKSVFDNSKILREVKIALLSDKVMKDYKSLFNSELCEFSKFLQD